MGQSSYLGKMSGSRKDAVNLPRDDMAAGIEACEMRLAEEIKGC